MFEILVKTKHILDEIPYYGAFCIIRNTVKNKKKEEIIGKNPTP